jgi:dephospho-CoA kinase
VRSPIQIGITGGIGSGKSLVSNIFHCLGIPVYDADSRAKNIMTTDGILISQIKKEFGALSYDANGALNRSLISGAVFNDPERLDVLNKLVHPRVGEDYRNWVNTHSSLPYLLKEAALLFESNSFNDLDKIIVVNAPENLRIKRVLQRDPQRTEQQVRDIIRNQMPEKEKLKKADFIIMNDEHRMVIPQVLKIHNEIVTYKK